MIHDPQDRSTAAGEPQKGRRSGGLRLVNVPNSLCALRLLGALFTPLLVHLDRPTWAFWVIIVMVVSDWIDGKLARWLNQRTEFGARLDSVADVAMYAAVLYSLWWMKWDFVREEAAWIGVAVISYVLSCAVGFARMGRWPNYHTRAAKISWLLMGIAILAVFGDYSVWPARVALAAVTLTNVEATAITLLLGEWRADLPSIYHAWKIKRQRGAAEGGNRA
jgi:cardiolipin synthase (CMP-forming)